MGLIVTTIIMSRISGLHDILLKTPTGFLIGKILVKYKTGKQEHCVKNRKELVPLLKNLVNVKITVSRWLYLRKKRRTAADGHM